MLSSSTSKISESRNVPLSIKSHIVCHAEWISTSAVKQSHGRGCSPGLLSGQFSCIIMKLALWCLHGTRLFTYVGVFNSKCSLTDGIRGFFNDGKFTLVIFTCILPFYANSNDIAGKDKLWFVTTVASLPTVSSNNYASYFCFTATVKATPPTTRLV